MAWFHETLHDAQKKAEAELEKPIKQQNWKEVFAILEEHAKVQQHEDHGLGRAASKIDDYLTELYQIRGFISEILKGRRLGVEEGRKSEMRAKFNKAVESAAEFEKILSRLIKDEKKLK